MACGYNPTLATDKDKVRFNLGDVGPQTWLLTDEEIGALLASGASVTLSTGLAAQSLAARYAQVVDHSIGGDISVSAGQLFDHYSKLATLYIERGGGEWAVSSLAIAPFAGGISQADVDTRNQDPDRVPPLLPQGQFDSTEVTGQEDTNR